MVGEHTRDIMRRLGYTTAEIDDMVAREIIYETTEDYRWTQ
jgi:crotonobetainyl-CoA:carnitine CoA-transferase CaiB-like acyl-CoA transferase